MTVNPEGRDLFSRRLDTTGVMAAIQIGSDLETGVRSDGIVEVCDKISGASLLISTSGLAVEPALEASFSSRDYGAKEPSISVCWIVRVSPPLSVRFMLLPICSEEDEAERSKLIQRLRGSSKSEIDNRQSEMT